MRHGAHFATWAEGLSAETVGEDLFSWPPPNFGPKTGLNLGEDLFFYSWSSPNIGPKTELNLSEDLFFLFLFSLHLILGRKADLILGWKIFILVFIILKFSEFPGPPPPFKNPAYATDPAKYVLIITRNKTMLRLLMFSQA